MGLGNFIPSAGGLGRRFGVPRLTAEIGDPTRGRDNLLYLVSNL